MGRRCGLDHNTVAVATLCSSCVHDVIKEKCPQSPADFSSEKASLSPDEAEVYRNKIATAKAHARVRLLEAQAAAWECRLSAAAKSTAQHKEAVTRRRKRMDRIDESQKKLLKKLVALSLERKELSESLQKKEKKRAELLRAHILQILSDFEIKMIPGGNGRTFTICGWSPDFPNDKERTASVEAAWRVLELVAQFTDFTPHTLQSTAQGAAFLDSIVNKENFILLKSVFRCVKDSPPARHPTEQTSPLWSHSLTRSRRDCKDGFMDTASGYIVSLGDGTEGKSLRSPREILTAFALEIHSERRRKAEDAAKAYEEDDVCDSDWECMDKPDIPRPWEPNEWIDAYSKEFLYRQNIL